MNFMKAVKAWRDKNPDPQEAYLASITNQVHDSFAFEGERCQLPDCEVCSEHKT